MRLLTEHIVVEVIDGDTFDVSPNWQFDDLTGYRVRIVDFDAPELKDSGVSGEVAKKLTEKLTSLILNKKITIVEGFTVDKYGRLICDVAFNNRNLSRLLDRMLTQIEEAATQRSSQSNR